MGETRETTTHRTKHATRIRNGASDLSTILFDLDNEYNVINESIAQDVRKKNRAKADKTAAERPSPFDQRIQTKDTFRGRGF